MNEPRQEKTQPQGPASGAAQGSEFEQQLADQLQRQASTVQFTPELHKKIMGRIAGQKPKDISG